MDSRRRGSTYSLLIIFVCTIIVSLYKFPDSLDIVRYYDSAKYAVASYSNLFDYAYDKISTDIDFIYTSVLYVFQKNHIPLNIATIIFLSIYYICIVRICKISYNLRGCHYLLCISLFCVPIDWTLTISRFLAAISFFYIAIICLTLHKYRIGLLFLIISIFTHVFILLFIVFLLISFLLYKLSLSRKLSNIILLSFIVVGFTTSFLGDLIQNLVSNFAGDLRYSAYADFFLETDSILKASRVDYGSKLGALFVYVVSIFLSLCDQNRNYSYWFLYILTCVLCVVFHSSVVLTNRVEMIMPLFIGLSSYSVLKSNNSSQVFVLKFLNVISVVVLLVVLYAARNIFF